MPRRRFDPLDALARGTDLPQSLRFFESLEEGVYADFLDSNRDIPSDPDDRPAVYARGNVRRMRLDRTVKKAAAVAELPIVVKRTYPASWSYPVVEMGPYSVTVGMADRRSMTARRHLRCHGKYMRFHVEQNDIADPQGSLFEIKSKITRLVPRGSIGAVIAIEPSLLHPDRPRYVGFWIPRPSLKGTYFRITMDGLIVYLRERIAASAPKKDMATTRKAIQRKPLKKRVRRKPDGK